MSNQGRILIADDEDTFLQATSELLRREGYTCTAVADAEAARQTLVEATYDLLIADIRMPGNSRLEFIDALERIAPGVPVILVTGYPSMETAIHAVRLPVMGYLVKPVDFDQMRATVARVIEHGRGFQTLRSMQQRLRDWSGELNELERHMSGNGGDTRAFTISHFTTLMINNMLGSMMDLKTLVESLAGERTSMDVCHMMSCPHLERQRAALDDAVDTLERTKHAFKSKELGQLRQRLERVLAEGVAERGAIKKDSSATGAGSIE